MTQRKSALVVTFEEPKREDDVEYLLIFFKQMKGVADVRLVDSDYGIERITALRRDAKWREELDALQVKMMNESRSTP